MPILRYLCFFPSITFGLLSAEVFPWATFFAVLKLRKIQKFLLFFIALLAVSAVLALIWTNQRSISEEVIRSFFAYLNPILIFAAILQFSKADTERMSITAKRVFIVLCVVFVIQVSGLFGFLDPVFKALVPRAAAEELGFRGITLLATEPSRASVEFLFIYFFVRFLVLNRRWSDICDVLVGAFIILAFKAATGVFVYGLFLVLFNRRMLIFALPVVLIYVIPNADALSGRAVTLIATLANLSLSDATFFIINTSGNRLISVIAAIQYGIAFPFGGGVGNWQETSVEALIMTGFDYTALNYFNAEWKDGQLYFRASGYAMNLMMDTGIIGVTVLTVLLFNLSQRFRAGSAMKQKFFYLFLVNIFFVGSVGTPVVWIVTALVLKTDFLDKKPAARAQRQLPKIATASNDIATVKYRNV